MAERPNSKNAKPPARARLDAVALIALTAGGVMLASIVTSQPISGQAFQLGSVRSAVDTIAAPTVLSLGFASVGTIFGWWTLTALYITRKPLPLYVVRGLGWAVLTVAGCLTADYASGQAGGLYGAGGSIGAYLRFQLDEQIPSAWLRVGMILALTGLGLALALPAAINLSSRMLVSLVKGLIKGNRLVEAANGWLLSQLGRIRSFRIRLPRRSTEVIIPLTAVKSAGAPPHHSPENRRPRRFRCGGQSVQRSRIWRCEFGFRRVR